MPLHLGGTPEELAPVAVLPGDPDRAHLIAHEFLESARCYSQVRGLVGYSGIWKGCPLTVQASGMGGPSAAIICEELAMLGVKTIIRIGTCGTLQAGVSAGSLVIANAACACDGASSQLASVAGYAPAASWGVTAALVAAAQASGTAFRVGTVASMDLFYDPRQAVTAGLRSLGVLALEMEAAAVFTVAALRGLQAGAVFAVTDTIVGQVRAERALIDRTVRSMIEVALDAALAHATGAGGQC